MTDAPKIEEDSNLGGRGLEHKIFTKLICFNNSATTGGVQNIWVIFLNQDLTTKDLTSQTSRSSTGGQTHGETQKVG